MTEGRHKTFAPSTKTQSKCPVLFELVYPFVVHVFKNSIFIRVCAKILGPKAKIDNFTQNIIVLIFTCFALENIKTTKIKSRIL